MINRLIITTVLLALSAFLVGCGGGTGSSSTPIGVNPGLPSIVKLMPHGQIAQTNSTITLTTKVLDGNGNPVPNVEVIYTNLSSLGVLSATRAMTNGIGQATVSLFSSDTGFATIQAEVSVGNSWVRDKRTIFYSIFDLVVPEGGGTGVPTLILEADSNDNGIFNEPADFILLQGPNNTQSIVRATVRDEAGELVAGDTVLFSSDSAEGTFPLGSTATTGANGQASVLLQVDPAILRTATTLLTVSGLSLTTGAGNLITFFLQPVSVSSVNVTATPNVVDSGGTSAIDAAVVTSAGTPAPDGTAVTFTTTNGVIEPFGQTVGGVASVTWTAPIVSAGFAATATITATAGGVSDSVGVNVVGPEPPPPTPAPALTAVPASVTLHCGTSVGTFTIATGTAPFTVTKIVSTDPVTIDQSPVGAVGGQFTVTAGPCAGLPASTTASLLIQDGASKTLTVTAIVTNP